jgi:hypothetical protein
MTLRSLEVGFHKTTKSYATIERATQVASEIARGCLGMVNVRIVASIGGGVRYTAVFYAFSEAQDRMFVANKGFVCHA